MDQVNGYLQDITRMIIEYAPRLGLAALVLVVGLRVVNKIADFIENGMKASGVGEEIRPFLNSMLSIFLKVLLVFSVAGIVGIETTSFVAVLAAAGFAVGMALQGSLSNFAAGIMILIFRPFKVNDLIEVEGNHGHVREIQIFNTIITTLDNRTVIIPNSIAMGQIITNFTVRESLRVDLQVPMPYHEDFNRVEQLLTEALAGIPEVLPDPAPFVGIHSYDSHYILLDVRVYAPAESYWPVYYATSRCIKDVFHKHGVAMAYSEGIELGSYGPTA